MLPATPEREGEIDSLRRRVESIRADLYAHLTPWQRVLVARHPARPSVLEYVDLLFTEFDRDPRRPALRRRPRHRDGLRALQGRAGARSSGTTRAAATPSRRSTGTSATRSPEGYRKALRVMQLAEKFGRPVIVFVDTPAAYPGIESEERGIAEAIALNLREMAVLDVPIIVDVCGEGGSGGALGHRRRRPHPDAGVRGLQRDPARGLRGDPLARLGQEGRGGRGAEDHRARPARPRHHRRDRPRAGRRRAHRPGAAAARCSIRVARAHARRGGRRSSSAERLDAAVREVPAAWGASARSSSTRAPR